MALSNFGVETIKSFFSKTGSFYVPNYQRDYSWEEKIEVNELWQDLTTVLDSKIDEYLLGQIVIHNDTSVHKNLIDGQQRTATLFLLFVSMKNYLKELQSNPKYDSATTDKIGKVITKIEVLLGIVDEDDKEDKLFLGDTDMDYFRDLIYRPDATLKNVKNEKRNARKNMCKTYKFFTKKFQEIVSERGLVNGLDYILKLNDCLQSNIKLLYVETEDENEAFMIFETLNARGRDLETSDLLKNYFFKTGGDKVDQIKKSWLKMSDKFDGYSITTYIRCVYNSKYNFCREKLLYKSIKDKCTVPKECLDFAQELEYLADLYLTMLDPDNHSFFAIGSHKNECHEAMRALSLLKNKTYYPLIIAYYNRNKSNVTITNELYQILNAILKIVVRDLVICKSNPNSYEMLFAELAKDFTDMKINTVDQIVNRIKSNSVSDEQFKASFEIYKEGNTAVGKDKIRYILRSIINYQAQSMHINTSNSSVHIEHIMPVAFSKWANVVTKDEHDEYLWRLGNLTLLDNELNQTIKDSLFDVKRAEYAKSDVNITKDLTKYAKWDSETITQRQKELYEIAKQIWSF